MIPTTAGCTLQEPAKSLYARLAGLERPPVASLSFACGFGPADIYHCGPSVLAYGEAAAATEAAAQELCDMALAGEARFATKIWPAAEAVAYAIRHSRGAARPVILADTQDNPGGGANSDTLGLLGEMIRQDAQAAVLGLLHDPAAAAAAHAAGPGADLTIGLGAGSGFAGEQPLRATYRVERLGDGGFTASGPFYAGARMELGPMALLALGGVRIAVGSRKLQAADQEIFRHLGVEPAAERILALKSSVHFRAHFATIAEEILVVAAPGPNPADLGRLAYRRLRPGVRRMPGRPI